MKNFSFISNTDMSINLSIKTGVVQTFEQNQTCPRKKKKKKKKTIQIFDKHATDTFLCFNDARMYQKSEIWQVFCCLFQNFAPPVKNH